METKNEVGVGVLKQKSEMQSLRCLRIVFDAVWQWMRTNVLLVGLVDMQRKDMPAVDHLAINRGYCKRLDLIFQETEGLYVRYARSLEKDRLVSICGRALHVWNGQSQ